MINWMINWSAQALIDLERHLKFLREIDHYSPEVVIAEIFYSVEQLPLNPGMGKKISGDIHQLVMAEPKYVIHYSVDDQITVLRVFHHRQKREI